MANGKCLSYNVKGERLKIVTIFSAVKIWVQIRLEGYALK